MTSPDTLPPPPGYVMARPVPRLLLLLCLTALSCLVSAGIPLSPGPEGAAGQLLVVVADAPDTSLASLYALERREGGWRRRLGPVPVTVGRNGFAPPGEKREGDGRTPTGLFPLESAFGDAPAIGSRMPYRQATADDLWVDDPDSADYNRWVRRGESRATSFEELKRRDHRYRYALVTGYNRSPTVAGHGSAIFLHLRQEEGFTTAGCVALPEPALVEILRWLEPARRPMILMGRRPDLAGLEPFPELPALPPAAVRRGAAEGLVRARAAGPAESRPERLVEYRSADGFFGMALAVPPAVAAEMRAQGGWADGCPVPLADLSDLLLALWGPDGSPRVGELVVHRKLATAVVKAFAELYAARVPVGRLERVERYGGDEGRSREAGNGSAFHCRAAAGEPGGWSRRSYGGTIDLPSLRPDAAAASAFTARGFRWRGTLLEYDTASLLSGGVVAGERP